MENSTALMVAIGSSLEGSEKRGKINLPFLPSRGHKPQRGRVRAVLDLK